MNSNTILINQATDNTYCKDIYPSSVRNSKYSKENPYRYSICQIPWTWFLSFHWKGYDYKEDSEFCFKNRRMIIKSLIKNTCKGLNIGSNDLQYFASDELKNKRVHTHAIIHKKNKVSVNDATVLKMLYSKIPRRIVSSIDKEKWAKVIEPVSKSKEASEYITKLNSNDFETHMNYHSKKFIDFCNSYRDHGFKIDNSNSF